MDDAGPLEPIDEPLKVSTSTTAIALDPALLDRLWAESGAGSWGLGRSDFDRILLVAALRQNFGLGAGAIAGATEQAEFFKTIKVADLVLAGACAEGNEPAWEHFVSTYGAQLTRAAIAISGSETVGRDLADAFYAELYGLNSREGKRKCPLESYRGRGSLLGWLRTTLSQRFVDHYRRTFREEALEEDKFDVPAAEREREPANADVLRKAVQDALTCQPAEERLVLAAYFLDGRTLAEISKVLHVHEATISRRLKKATESVRKALLKNLEKSGLSRRAAQEALGTDPRDLELGMNLKELLQHSGSGPFMEQMSSDAAAQRRGPPGSLYSNAADARTTEGSSER